MTSPSSAARNSGDHTAWGSGSAAAPRTSSSSGLGEPPAGRPQRGEGVADEAGPVALEVALVAGEHELEQVVDVDAVKQLLDQRRRA